MAGKQAAKDARAAKEESKLMEMVAGLQLAVLSLTGKVDEMSTNIKRLRKGARAW